MAITFTKLQAAGNDFIVIDARNIRRDWHRLAQNMCHRHLGIGSDGLILVKNSTRADFEMKMINPDGSEAQVCGNGLRCFAKYVVDNGLLSGELVNVSTPAGVKSIKVFTSHGKVSRAKVNMGPPHFKAEELPVMNLQTRRSKGEFDIKPILDYQVNIAGRNLSLSFVSMGNPHAVHFITTSVAKFPLDKVGPKVEYHQMFPERTNFEIARVINRKKIEARVWERGAGETLACGSGACAIAVAAKLKGFTDGKVDIILKGGKLTIFWDGEGDVFLTGPVKEVFVGKWPE